MCVLAQRNFTGSPAHRHTELRRRSQSHARPGWIFYYDRGRETDDEKTDLRLYIPTPTMTARFGDQKPVFPSVGDILPPNVAEL